MPRHQFKSKKPFTGAIAKGDTYSHDDRHLAS
eukprot:CAMPEP_0184317602 /NCGR_PEP_ID=MMETSP1049-20130417/97556_1 /TAXON_ID=77928 /ORGANISM="Proteomonas sulcata, Strain CCMP704" /LENGTH=31 /DNA_ID= /DNA_START= /DNA_END= /DNA_ORIENTATION=